MLDPFYGLPVTVIIDFARRIEQKELREEYLMRTRGEDAQLRVRVDALLTVYDEGSDVWELHPSASSPTFELPITEERGTVVDRYTFA